MSKYFCLILVLVSQLGHLCASEPASLYLTWLHDPTTTMTIQWHTSKMDTSSLIKYKKEGDSVWHEQSGSSYSVAQFDVNVHTLELQGLEAGSEYAFYVGEQPRIYRFRTMPATTEKPVRFVVAGDAYYYLHLLRKMNEQIAKTDPDFVVVGGDIAYTNGHATLFRGKDWEIKRWGTFFSEWKDHMVTSDGRLIPMIVVIGNHDVKKSYVKDEGDGFNVGIKNEAPGHALFYDLFAMPKEELAYRVLDFGTYLSLFLLDTGHSSPIGQAQKQWLEENLQARQGIVNKMAAYHVSAYPSVYRFSSSIPTKIRKHWVPLFEQYHVQTAFEHHNHAYKRTYPIKEGKIDPEGVLYLGDGAWGVPPRKTLSPKKTWYLAKASPMNCFWQVTILDEKCSIKSFDIRGKLIEDLEKITQESPLQAGAR